MPKGQYDRASSAWTPTPQRVYDPDLVRRVREVYEGGATMRETAMGCGVTLKVLQRLMPRHGITRRPPIPRDQRGARNPQWKGSAASYGAMHRRVVAAKGRPAECEACGTTDPNARYEWANLTGRYDDVNDFARLCLVCHKRLDQIRRHELGTFTSPVATGAVLSASGHPGVVWHKEARRWQAQAQLRGRFIYLGMHSSIEDAVAARAFFIDSLPRVGVSVGGAA